MPQIDVSDSLYEQLETAADGDDIENALWQMTYLFQRGNDPSE
ncbi:phosphohydrolase [Natronorarus salvus]